MYQSIILLALLLSCFNAERIRKIQMVGGGNVRYAESMMIKVDKVIFYLFDTERGLNHLKACHALKLAGILLQNNVHFIQPIYIYVQKVSPCLEEGRCISDLALGTPSALYRVRDRFSPHTLYPQALIKQLPHLEPQILSLKPVDIKVEVNLDYDFYYPKDYPQKVDKYQYDFLDLVLHEILHGLGFFSNLEMRDFGYVTTTPVKVDVHQLGFRSTIYDWYLYDNLTHLHFASILNDNIQLYPSWSITDAINKANLTMKYLQLTTAALTSNRIVFRSRSDISLESASDFQTPSHLSINYQHSKDAIMSAVANKGEGIPDYITNFKDWHSSPFGPNTLDILATLGYQLKLPNPKRSLQYYYHYKLSNNGSDPDDFGLEL